MNNDIKLYSKVYFLDEMKIREGIILEITSKSEDYYSYDEILHHIEHNISIPIKTEVMIESRLGYTHISDEYYHRNIEEVFLSKEELKEYIVNKIK